MKPLESNRQSIAVHQWIGDGECTSAEKPEFCNAILSAYILAIHRRMCVVSPVFGQENFLNSTERLQTQQNEW